MEVGELNFLPPELFVPIKQEAVSAYSRYFLPLARVMLGDRPAESSKESAFLRFILLQLQEFSLLEVTATQGFPIEVTVFQLVLF